MIELGEGTITYVSERRTQVAERLSIGAICRSFRRKKKICQFGRWLNNEPWKEYTEPWRYQIGMFWIYETVCGFFR